MNRVVTTLSRPAAAALLLWGILVLAGVLALDLGVMPFLTGYYRAQAAVPGLVGTAPEAAAKKLERAGLILMIDSLGEYSPAVRPGLILSQRPVAGATVKVGRRVWVKVSRGYRSIHVPPLRNLSLRKTEIALQRAGLRLGNVMRTPDDEAPEGVVVRASPAQGAPAEANSYVDVFVSSGPGENYSAFPNLTGMSLRKAEKIIARLKMTVGEVRYEMDEVSLPNTVLSHQPGSTDAIVPGEAVDLVVSGPAP